MLKKSAVMLIVGLSLASCSDKYEDVFISECTRATGASSSDCGCAAGKVKEIMSDKEWQIMGMNMLGDTDAAEIEAAKLGVGGMFGILSHWASAIGVAESQCSISGLSRM
jgi:hypothetical protein